MIFIQWHWEVYHLSHRPHHWVHRWHRLHITVRTYPNQKPWIRGNIRIELKARAAAFKERDTNKESRYALRRTFKQAKHQYRIKIESYYTGSDARWMWQGLKTITDYKGKLRRELPSDTGRWAKCLLCSRWGKQHWRMHKGTSCSGRLCDNALGSRCEQDL